MALISVPACSLMACSALMYCKVRFQSVVAAVVKQNSMASMAACAPDLQRVQAAIYEDVLQAVKTTDR